VKVAVAPVLVTVPDTGMDVLVAVKSIVPVVTVSGSMLLLKVTVTGVLAWIPVELLAGFIAATVAGLKSAAVPVVKVALIEGIRFPLRSCTPVTLRV
jgi:hypothetical protein